MRRLRDCLWVTNTSQLPQPKNLDYRLVNTIFKSERIGYIGCVKSLRDFSELVLPYSACEEGNGDSEEWAHRELQSQIEFLLTEDHDFDAIHASYVAEQNYFAPKPVQTKSEPYCTKRRNPFKNVFKPQQAQILDYSRYESSIEKFISPYVCVGFIGRSNVGKSSLINSVFQLYRKSKLRATTSKTPGRTQLAHVYGAGALGKIYENRQFPKYGLIGLDLPGYGYAKTSLSTSQAMSNVIRAFLGFDTEVTGHSFKHLSLEKIFLLIDCRRGLQDYDRLIMDMMDRSGLIYQPVLTKSDLLGESELDRVAREVLEEILLPSRSASWPQVVAVSCKTNLGIRYLQGEMLRLLSLNQNSQRYVKLLSRKIR